MPKLTLIKRALSIQKIIKPYLKNPVRIVLIILVLMGALNIPGWRHFYRSNCNHLENVYRKMGLYMKENLPANARIAAFDIGMIKWVSDLYIIDTAGLIDPGSHKYLAGKSMIDVNIKKAGK